MSGEGVLAALRGLVENNQVNNLKIRYGTHTTASATDTVATGLTAVLGCAAVLGVAPTHDNTMFVTAAPSGGNLAINSYKPTAVDNCTPTAATTFGKTVYWVAVGT